MGLAPTRAAARQLVSHRHITVDGSVVNIPSYSLKAGQLVGVREKSKSLESINSAMANSSVHKYSWLEWDQHSMTGKDRKSTRLNSSHVRISYAVFCLKKKKKKQISQQ